MKVRRTPPLIAQVAAALVVLVSIAVALNLVFVGSGPHHGGHLDGPEPWWGRLLRLCILLLVFTIPALAYRLTHQFFCWSYRGYGYPERPPRIRFRHLFLIAAATITIGANLLFWALMADDIWIPPYLEPILRFGILWAPLLLLAAAASLYLKARRMFWFGLVVSLASLGLYFVSPLSRAP
jgi:hypothetical protein